ncbi:hypothetical protein [Brachybacterium sp. J153]|uniref:hypothetical protein n=1 Tax=Brachybacterium sp. J153 TaxID=3116488 RepID=UPI002E76EE7F|nr:hypothetical protein [Brachybacterium sp. J153]MEE1619666.1 hypothetical protein [Brachybacterium sp. J153]
MMGRGLTRRTVIATGVVGGLALSGCSGGGGGGETDESGRPIVTVQVITDARAKAMSEMPWTKDLEEAAGCTIRWQETASSSWDQQKQAALAAGDVADVTISGYGAGDWGDYSSLFLDLTPELANMPNLSATFESAPYAKVASLWDGKIFGAPAVNIGSVASGATHMFINKKWLDELGLDVPTTWSELETALIAFKEENPNGSGKNDEIPLDFNPPGSEGWGGFQPNVLMGSYGIPVTGGGSGMYAEGGVIKNYLTHPGYKNLAIYLNKLWKQGLISSEAFTQDWSKYTSTAKGEGDVAKVGVTWMWTPSDIFGTELADQYITIPSLKVEDSEKDPVWCFSGDGLNYGPNKISVSAQVGNKEAALKVVDAFFLPDISVQARYGAFDLAVKKNGEKDYTVLEPEDKSKNSSDWQFQNSLADRGPGWVTQPGVTVTLPKEHVEVREVDAVYDEDYARLDLNKDVIYGGVSFTAEESQEYSLNDTGIGQYAMSTFAKWVTEGGAEAEWDGYLAELEKNKLPDQIRIQQAAYDRYITLLQDEGTDLNKELAGEGIEYEANDDGSGTITNTN